MAWYRKTAWMASRTGLLPRKENETFEMPPEVLAYGRVREISLTASMKSTP